MNRLIFKTFYLPLSLILIASCGGGKEEEEFKFYALKEATSQQLELDCRGFWDRGGHIIY